LRFQRPFCVNWLPKQSRQILTCTAIRRVLQAIDLVGSSQSHAASDQYASPCVKSGHQGWFWLLNWLNITVSDLLRCKGTEQDMKLQVKACHSEVVVLEQHVAGTGTEVITKGHDTQDYAQRKTYIWAWVKAFDMTALSCTHRVLLLLVCRRHYRLHQQQTCKSN